MTSIADNKLKTLYIMDALLEKSDEKHPLSTQDLLTELKRQGINAERKSIYNDIAALQHWGLDIIYTKAKPSGYYIGVRDFELAELKLLVDAVQSSKFITLKKSNELISKLERLASKSDAKQLHRHVFVTNRIKAMNETIYYSVDKTQEAIAFDLKITFTYLQWNTDCKLVPKSDGKTYVISPWALTWDDENYYMIGFDTDSGMVKHYRVDKMQRIELLNESRDGKDAFGSFDTARFATRTFGMFGGEIVPVTLQCENSLIGAIIDRFGKDIIIQKIDHNHFCIRHEITVSGQFFGWLVGLGPGARIVSPEDVAEDFKARLKSML